MQAPYLEASPLNSPSHIVLLLHALPSCPSNGGAYTVHAPEQVSQLLKIIIESFLSSKRVWNAYHLLFLSKKEVI